eukprot:TRINITY_DN2115_c1_g1_i1.p2 TRINITY_DN2115_c1_g1~~TRINITY_DN2115_c1_g1_i1.p2  ORF type:complete len:404 (+),score=125.92 TRINITY_DN2115_c1_g1_i1:79-1212(+)
MGSEANPRRALAAQQRQPQLVSVSSGAVAAPPAPPSEEDPAPATFAAPGAEPRSSTAPDGGDEAYAAACASWRAAQPRCMPCTGMRAAMSPMVLVLLGLSALTYYPYVIANPAKTAKNAFAILVFHVLLALMLLSYFQAVLTDAGSVPEWWAEEVARLGSIPHLYCQRTTKVKPPRSHFDSVTRRHVLNMDHFCPWVANTVGFYNRKFFVQFLVYCAATCLWAAGTMVVLFPDQALPWGSVSAPRGGCARLRSAAARTACFHKSREGNNFQIVMLIALMVDAIFGAILVCFAGFHIQMILTNETTIEFATWAEGWKYNVGRRANWEQVCGRNPLYWVLPIWGPGPAGDGLNWPTQEPRELPLERPSTQRQGTTPDWV